VGLFVVVLLVVVAGVVVRRVVVVVVVDVDVDVVEVVGDGDGQAEDEDAANDVPGDSCKAGQSGKHYAKILGLGLKRQIILHSRFSFPISIPIPRKESIFHFAAKSALSGKGTRGQLKV